MSRKQRILQIPENEDRPVSTNTIADQLGVHWKTVADDLEEMLHLVEKYEPDMAVIGDAHTADEAQRYQEAADNLPSETKAAIVPKCSDAFDAVADTTTVGWPNGYADMDPLDYSTIDQWRDQPVWVLGGNPQSQHHVIDLLTQPTVDDQPPSDIVGVNGNSCFKAALYGEYWTPDGYQAADQFSLRETVRRSLEEIKMYWKDRGVWPDDEPVDRYGPAVVEPDGMLWYDDGGAPIETQEAVESAYIGEYGEETVAYWSKSAKRFMEYRGHCSD